MTAHSLQPEVTTTIVVDTALDMTALDAYAEPPRTPLSLPVARTSPLTPGDLNAELHRVDLPSDGAFYPPQVYARLVRGREQAKFTRASKTRSLEVTVEAVTACLEGVNALDLTMPDFFYLLYWLRLNSYTKSQFTHVSVCTNHDHLAKVARGELPPESLRTAHVISHTNIEETLLDRDKLGSLDVSVCGALGIGVYPPTMRTAVELEAFMGRDAVDQDDVTLIDEYASCIGTVNGAELSLAERLELVKQLSADALCELRAAATLFGSYGVQETAKVRCKECGAEHVTAMSVSAHNFS